MKTKNIVAFVLVVVLLVGIIGALYLITSRQTKVTELDGLRFEDLCRKNRDMWMEMEPWRDGKEISDEKCHGCMIGENHFCNVEEYIAYIKELKGENVEQADQSAQSDQSAKMGHDMHGMQNVMTVHAGGKNVVDVHKYTIELLAIGRELGEISELVFKIEEKDSGRPVTNLDIVHDKIMHVILVRNDLRYFDHIHPVDGEPGVFSVPYNFKAPGEYRIWVDFTKDEVRHIVDFDVDIPLDFVEDEADKLKGLRVDMKALDDFKVGEDVRIDFVVSDKDGNPAPIREKFLAANAHMIVIDESLDEFGHNHDEKLDNDNVISFVHKFENVGRHKLWVQFSVGGAPRTAEFEVVIGNWVKA